MGLFGVHMLPICCMEKPSSCPKGRLGNVLFVLPPDAATIVFGSASAGAPAALQELQTVEEFDYVTAWVVPSDVHSCRAFHSFARTTRRRYLGKKSEPRPVSAGSGLEDKPESWQTHP